MWSIYLCGLKCFQKNGWMISGWFEVNRTKHNTFHPTRRYTVEYTVIKNKVVSLSDPDNISGQCSEWQEARGLHEERTMHVPRPAETFREFPRHLTQCRLPWPSRGRSCWSWSGGWRRAEDDKNFRDEKKPELGMEEEEEGTGDYYLTNLKQVQAIFGHLFFTKLQ